MSNYTKLVNYIVKDSLPTGNPAKIIKGTELDNEFSAIASNMATKLDSSGGTLLNGTLSGATVATGSLSVSGTTAFTGTTAFRNATNSFFNGAGTDAIFNIDGVNGKIYGSGVGTSGNQIELNRSSDTNHPILAFTRTRGSLAAPTDNVANDVLSSLDSYARIGGVSSRATYIRSEVSTLTDSTDMVFSVKNAGAETELFRLLGSQVDGNTAALAEFTQGVRINASNALCPFRITYTGSLQELATINDSVGRQLWVKSFSDGTDTKTGHLYLSTTQQNSDVGIGTGAYVYDSALPVTPTLTGVGILANNTVGSSLAGFRSFNSSPILKNGAIPTGIVTGYRANAYTMEAGATNASQFQYGFDSTVGTASSLGILQNYSYHTNAAVSGEGTITSFQITSNVATVGYTLTSGQHPAVGEILEFFVPEFTSTGGSFNGSRTISAVDTVALTMQFSFTATDVPLTTVTVTSGWTSTRNRSYVASSTAPSVLTPAVFVTSSTYRTPAVRIRNTGLGASLYIEDGTSDATPFVIDVDGVVIAGDRFARQFNTDTNTLVTPRLYTAFGSSAGNNSVFSNYSASAAAANHYFYKSRSPLNNGVTGTLTTVQGGDNLGIIGFLADDGATVGGIESARIQNRVCGLPATGNVQSETTIYQRSNTGRSVTEINGYFPVANFSSDGLDVPANFGIKGNMVTGGINLAAATIRATSAINFDSTPTGFAFSNDGTKLFVVASTLDQIREYNLTTAWDTTTSVFVQSLSIAAQEGGAGTVVFNSTGTVLYFSGVNSDAIFPVTLPTAFSLTGATIGTGVLFSTIFNNALGVTAPNNVNDIYFSADGLNLYATDSSVDRIFQAKMTVPFDVTTATFYGRNPFSLANIEGVPTGFWLSSDGTWGLIAGSSTDRVVQFVLSVPFDITTLHVIPGVLNAAAATPVAELNPSAVFYRPELNRLYLMGLDTDDIIEYNVPRRTAVINHDTTFTNRVVLPRMTTVERNALLNVVDGTVIYNTTTNEYNFRQAGAWVKPTMSAA